MNHSTRIPHHHHHYDHPLQNPASDPVLEMLISNAAVEDGPYYHTGTNSKKNLNLLEGSWNGLFLTNTSGSDAGMDDSLRKTSKRKSGTADPFSSNKKMGHTSFTDLGVYDAKANQQHSLQRVTEGESIGAKSKFMRLRLERLGATAATRTDEEEQTTRRMNSSDSALMFLRKDSNMENNITDELQGSWYRARHPKMIMAQHHNSAPCGSIFDDFDAAAARDDCEL